MVKLLGIIALFLFVLGFVLILKAFRVPTYDRPRYLRAGVGAMAAGAGNALLFKQPSLGMLLLLVGVMLIFTSGTGTRRGF